MASGDNERALAYAVTRLYEPRHVLLRFGRGIAGSSHSTQAESPAQESLEKYAAVVIGVGLGVERGDRVMIASSVQLPDFTRILVATAYEAGAVSVDVFGFTSPHRMKAEGRIQAIKPLSYFGDLVEGLALQLSEGLVVKAEAERGQEVLDAILATDEGSARFGEAAMVPQTGAEAAEDLVWYDMLYDENDACHIALGSSYTICHDGASDMTDEQRLDAGLNQSSVHVDFVVGSADLNVYGVTEDATEEPIIVDGDWGFTP